MKVICKSVSCVYSKIDKGSLWMLRDAEEKNNKPIVWYKFFIFGNQLSTNTYILLDGLRDNIIYIV